MPLYGILICAICGRQIAYKVMDGSGPITAVCFGCYEATRRED